jgi:hypothetical protein
MHGEGVVSPQELHFAGNRFEFRNSDAMLKQTGHFRR